MRHGWPRGGGYTGGMPASEMRPPMDVRSGALVPVSGATSECRRCGTLAPVEGFHLCEQIQIDELRKRVSDLEDRLTRKTGQKS